jgi:hypothetical protein
MDTNTARTPAPIVAAYHVLFNAPAGAARDRALMAYEPARWEHTRPQDRQCLYCGQGGDLVAGPRLYHAACALRPVNG